MLRTRLRYFKASSLASTSDLPSVVIRLMLAVNDIALAADANDFWAETTEQRRAYRKGSARMYFIRLIMSHVHEALKIVGEINKHSELRAAVDQCDEETQAAFKKLVAAMNSPERGQLFRFRTKATFHYDDKVPADHLQKILADDPDASFSYSTGSTALDWHYELADAVMDRMVVRYVFGADEIRSRERSRKIGEFATRLDEIATTFTLFASRYVQRSLKSGSLSTAV